ncbi:hypothetical protein [Acetobacterium sp.]|jgi:hypothetical protein|uniref:hypothetical protein n=1 Tax=Acetobacterium sp. TaxID=1872094 RepID=UPI000CB3D779|nr:hypothetical protein [Acetobacterium sp.]MDO9492770.1 hypothetical protein [Acetobacterium sp.]PKM74642.1 MAG: hypothetical protein CVU92_05465 [Firmicutes bacterium HGW-Firmicutes-17]
MKIESSTVAMASQSSYKEATKAVESLKTWDAQGNSKTTTITNSSAKGMDTLEISKQARDLQLNTLPPLSTVPSDDETASLSSKEEQQLTLLKRMIQALTGKKIKFVMPKKVTLEDPKMSQAIQSAYSNRSSLQAAAAGWAQGLAGAQPRSNASNSSGGGFEYSQSVTHYESQSTSFQAQASVTTSDGRQINIDLQLNLSREFMSQSNLTIQGGNQPVQVDPLVINYDAGSASVTAEKYAFDIDANGTLDQISFVGPGSGFLALDSNGDGKINDGSELFGPQSGNGFSDLAKYDSDGNNWIDENDAIYEKLQIWSKDSAGKDVLMALGQKGVGAIYLGNVSTSFALKGADNQTNGQLQRTGIYLNEDGSAGTVQHIDLSI